MDHKPDMTYVNALDHMTDLVLDEPETQLALYLLRNTADKMKECRFTGDGETLTHRILHKLEAHSYDTLSDDLDELMLLLCSGATPDPETAPELRAEALRCFRRYRALLSPRIGPEREKRLSAMEKLPEEVFDRTLRSSRAERMSKLMHRQAEMSREVLALLPDPDQAAARMDEAQSRREQLNCWEEKIQEIFKNSTEISSSAAFGILDDLEKSDAGKFPPHTTTLMGDED